MKFMTFLKKHFKNGKFSAGFTVIEMIVVVAIFLFVIGATITLFIAIFKYQKKVLAEQELINQVSYVEEYVSKALRMAKVSVTEWDADCLDRGYIYELDHAVQLGSTTIYEGVKFLNQSDVDADGNAICQEIFLDHADPDNTNSPLVLKEIKAGGSAIALTATNLELDEANPIKFVVNGVDCSGGVCGVTNSDNAQPRITITMNIKVAGDNEEPIRTVQTTVSQRNLNIK